MSTFEEKFEKYFHCRFCDVYWTGADRTSNEINGVCNKIKVQWRCVSNIYYFHANNLCLWSDSGLEVGEFFLEMLDRIIDAICIQKQEEKQRIIDKLTFKKRLSLRINK